MKRVLKKSGCLIIHVPNIMFPKHEHPHDYYRFTKEACEKFFIDMSDVVIEIPKITKMIFGVGIYNG